MKNGAKEATANPKTTTIDTAGRLVVPKSIRRDAGFLPGTLLEVRLDDGRVVLEPAPRQVSIRQRGEFYVAEPSGEDAGHDETMTREEVERTLRRVRDRTT